MMTETTFEITQAQSSFLSTFMNKVSRSFAIVVPCLEEPLNHFMATTYLICRVVDNIEDCGEPFGWKKKRFAEFSRLLGNPSLASDMLSAWEHEPWPSLTSDEKLLMSSADGMTLWQVYGLIPDEARDTIRRWTCVMARGMSQLEDPTQAPRLVCRNGVQILAAEEDYDGYCYFVAGTVGHLATELVSHHYQLTDGIADRLLANCEAFGRALQKTNIVKDFAEDLARGICYLPDEWMTEVDRSPLSLTNTPTPWKQKVLDNVMDELETATDYVLTLPYDAAGYRLASLLCLLPAYQTILLAAQQHETLFTDDHHVKISRETFSQCLQDAQSMMSDNDAILQYSRDLKNAVDATFDGPGRTPVV